MELSRDHITLLLNALYNEGITKIPVEHPCEQIGTLFEIQLTDHESSRVRIKQGAVTYRDNRAAVARDFGEQPHDDLPDEHAYVKAFVGGGLLAPENDDDLQQFFDRHTHPDLAAGHNPVMVAYDTNLFGFRLPERLGIDPVVGQDDSQGRPPTNGYALSEGVREELDWHYDHYSTRNLTEAFGKEFARLGDQPAGANRAGLLGLYEFRDRMANRAVDIVPSETGDDQIIETYLTYDKENRKRVLLLSNDYEFVEIAQERGLWAHHVSFAVDTPRSVTGSWQEVADTLYLLTVLFGVLKLPKVTLYGVWEEKSGLEWQHEQIDIDVRSPVLKPVLERDKAIVSEFESISDGS